MNVNMKEKVGKNFQVIIHYYYHVILRIMMTNDYCDHNQSQRWPIVIPNTPGNSMKGIIIIIIFIESKQIKKDSQRKFCSI